MRPNQLYLTLSMLYRYPAREGICGGDQCPDSIPVSPADEQLIETVWHRFVFMFDFMHFINATSYIIPTSSLFLFADFEQRTLIFISTDFRSYVLMKAVTAPHRTTAPVPGHLGPKPFRPGTPQNPPKLNF